MFGAMCPSSFFMETVPGPPEQEKLCIHILCPERTGMHYMTQISHQMQKQKFDVMCPGVLFMKTTPGAPEHEK
jgi:hypothetical protein